MCRIIGIDPGSEESGMVVLDGCNIVAFNLTNVVQLYDKITNYSICNDLTIVIEDIKPYSLRLTPQVIDTCKFIGELVYRLRIDAGLNVVMISRYEVKKWCFDTFPGVCLPIIDSKIEKKMFDACDLKTRELIRVDCNGRSKRKASFVFVDDKVVTECMKHKYKIPLPKAGKGYQFGLQTHSWQALAVASFFKQQK
jgi:hypothetical protein